MKFYSLMFCQFRWLVYIYYINQAGSVYIDCNFSIFFFFLNVHKSVLFTCRLYNSLMRFFQGMICLEWLVLDKMINQFGNHFKNENIHNYCNHKKGKKETMTSLVLDWVYFYQTFKAMETVGKISKVSGLSPIIIG